MYQIYVCKDAFFLSNELIFSITLLTKKKKTEFYLK